MSVELVERAAQALQFGKPTRDERTKLAAAMAGAAEFADLAEPVQRLIEALESRARERFGPLPGTPALPAPRTARRGGTGGSSPISATHRKGPCGHAP